MRSELPNLFYVASDGTRKARKTWKELVVIYSGTLHFVSIELDEAAKISRVIP